MADSFSQTTKRGRFAPTPSGRMHLGNVWSLLLAWLDARSSGAEIVLRIEDIDPRGAKAELATLLIEDLKWLGLDWDLGPIYQHDRLQHYQAALERLEELGLCYPCFCTRSELHAASAPHRDEFQPIYPGTCRNLSPAERTVKATQRSAATRLMVPSLEQANFQFSDGLCGPQQQNLVQDCGDFIIQRSDKVFAYQLAVTVDDCEMGISHVVRGNDLLESTFRQLYIAQLLSYKAPRYTHVPLLVDEKNRRLSKRDKDLDLGVMRAEGLSPEHIVSYLAYLMGLNSNLEKICLNDLLSVFNWSALQTLPRAIFVDADMIRKF